MPKMDRDTSKFTPFGLLLDRLCMERHISFHQLAARSGMKSHASVLRACRGQTTPRRENILAWCNVLQVTPEQRASLLHAFHYAAPEEEESERT